MIVNRERISDFGFSILDSWSLFIVFQSTIHNPKSTISSVVIG